jgi:hypothetical protein
VKGKLIFFLLFYLLGQAAFQDAFSQGDSSMDLDVYRWKHRLLMVFSPSPEDLNYQSFRKEMEGGEKGLRERDIVRFEVLEKGPSRLGDSPMNKGAADALRRKFAIRPGQFCILLIGKDGEEKRRWESTVGLEVIFSVVDSMPMRQREMKEKG